MAGGWLFYTHIYNGGFTDLIFGKKDHQKCSLHQSISKKSADCQLVVYDAIFGSWATYEEAFEGGIKALRGSWESVGMV